MTVTGDGFRPGFNQAFKFGSIPAVNAQCSSTTQCTMGTPAAPAPGPLDVTYGGWPNGPAFIYLGPGITDVIPSSGSENGGDIVTILGRGFSNNMTLMFGAVPISGFSCSSDGTCRSTYSRARRNRAGRRDQHGQWTNQRKKSSRRLYLPGDALWFHVADCQPCAGGTIVTITDRRFDAAPGGTSSTLQLPGHGRLDQRRRTT